MTGMMSLRPVFDASLNRIICVTYVLKPRGATIFNLNDPQSANNALKVLRTMSFCDIISYLQDEKRSGVQTEIDRIKKGYKRGI